MFERRRERTLLHTRVESWKWHPRLVCVWVCRRTSFATAANQSSRHREKKNPKKRTCLCAELFKKIPPSALRDDIIISLIPFIQSGLNTSRPFDEKYVHYLRMRTPPKMWDKRSLGGLPVWKSHYSDFSAYWEVSKKLEIEKKKKKMIKRRTALTISLKMSCAIFGKMRGTASWWTNSSAPFGIITTLTIDCFSLGLFRIRFV